MLTLSFVKWTISFRRPCGGPEGFGLTVGAHDPTYRGGAPSPVGGDYCRNTSGKYSVGNSMFRYSPLAVASVTFPAASTAWMK